MKVTFYPSTACGEVSAPPSKSDAHRALIAAALSKGSLVSNLAFSKDVTATLECLRALGASITPTENGAKIGRLSADAIPSGATLDCIESGSTLRFLLPLCMCGKEITLKGSKRLLSRPLSVYEEICKKDGISYSNDGKRIKICGRLKGGEYSVRGDISSQFITGLLFALPICDKDSVLKIEGAFESESYVNMSLATLSRFGINIERKENSFYIKGNQDYRSCDVLVEGDYSNAAFLEGFNLLGGSVRVNGLSADTLQGDSVYLSMYERLKTEENGQFSLKDCPDLAPVMFALAAEHGGATFTDTKRLKIKESDRAEAMKKELAKFGVFLTVNENSVIVPKAEITPPRETLCGHNDHRIVMALSLLCSKYGGVIEGCEAVDKSFPDFFEKVKALGVRFALE